MKERHAFLWTSYSDSGIILGMDVLIDIFAGVFGVATARNRHPGGTPLPPRFYQTKPFVMLRKSYLCGTGRRGYVDYRKMTNGFVFLEMRAPGRSRIPLTRTLSPKGRGKRLPRGCERGMELQRSRAGDAMARGVFELMKAPGCLKGCWCGGRWFDRLTMTDRGGRGAIPGRQGCRPTIGDSTATERRGYRARGGLRKKRKL